MTSPFLIEMKPHPTSPGSFRGTTATVWQVSRAGVWFGDFASLGKAQLFINAMRYVEGAKASGHIDAHRACEYLLRDVISLE